MERFSCVQDWVGSGFRFSTPRFRFDWIVIVRVIDEFTGIQKERWSPILNLMYSIILSEADRCNLVGDFPHVIFQWRNLQYLYRHCTWNSFLFHPNPKLLPERRTQTLTLTLTLTLILNSNPNWPPTLNLISGLSLTFIKISHYEVPVTFLSLTRNHIIFSEQSTTSIISSPWP